MKFVSVDEGYVNLDHVARIRDFEKSKTRVFYGLDGNMLGQQTGYNIDSAFLNSYIPASGDQYVVLVSVYKNEKSYVEKFFVLSWSIEPDGTINPILPENIINEYVVYPCPDGKFSVPGYGIFDGLDKAISFLEDAHGRISDEKDVPSESAS